MIFNPNAKRYLRQTINQCEAINENEEKHHYNQIITEIDQRRVTSLSITVNGGMAIECKVFYSRLASLLSIKRGVEKLPATTWITTKINFA